MSHDGQARRPIAFGLRRLTFLTLLGAALAGLALCSSQVPLWGFGDDGPNARSLPWAALSLLSAALIARLATELRAEDIALGRGRDWLALAGVLAATIAALALMPRFGFPICAAGLAIVTTLCYGERNPWLMFGLPILAAAIISLGAERVLGIPLP